MAVHDPCSPRARFGPLGLVFLIALAGCSDRELPTSLGPDGAALDQVASAPVVNDLGDPGDGTCDAIECTLREAIAFASEGAEITFSVSGTITISEDVNAFEIRSPLTIAGPGPSSLTVAANSWDRVFYIETGAVEISGMTITGGTSTADGGGIENHGVLTLEDCAVEGNSADSDGGGIYSGPLSASIPNSLSITNCTISDNEALNGAGIFSASELTITGTTISGNTATNEGGGVNFQGGSNSTAIGITLTITGSTISNNTAGSNGGGIISDTDHDITGPALGRIRNSTFSGNSVTASAGYGGGVYNYWGRLEMVLSTVTNNTAPSGAGLASYNDNQTQTDLKGNIIWGNTDAATAGDVAAVQTATPLNSLGYNVVGAAGFGVNFASDFTATGDATDVADAGIGALALNSPGTTETHALVAGSPAIDRVTSCTDGAGGSVATDQRGVGRPQGSACDAGAFELEAGGGTTPTFGFDLSSLTAKTYGDGPFSVAGSPYITTNSSGAVTFATGSGSVGCSVTPGGTVTLTAATTGSDYCIIEASLAPDATYTAAGPISQSFQIAKATASVSIDNLPSTAMVGGSFTPSYATNSDGTASTASNTAAVCSVSDGVVSFTAAGTCELVASVAASANYLSATGSAQTFTVYPVLVFTFDLSALPAKTYGDPGFSVVGYTTTNSSGAITFATGTGSVGCSVSSGGDVTITSGATGSEVCILVASLAAAAPYSSGGPISQSFHIAKATTSVTIANLPASGLAGSSYVPTYSTSSDGTTSTTSSTPSVCTVDAAGSTVSFVEAGTCELVAHVAESTKYLGADGGVQSIPVSYPPFSSSCTYETNPRNGRMDVTISWANAHPGVTLIHLNDGRTVTKAMAPTETGSWSTGMKASLPTYGLWGGADRKDAGTVLVEDGTACTPAT